MYIKLIEEDSVIDKTVEIIKKSNSGFFIATESMFGFMNKSQDCYLEFNSYGIRPIETKSDMKEDKISMRVISFNI